MKKVLIGLVVLFVGIQLITSCSSENNVLSQFSKRKYMKRFKSKDLKYKNVINERKNEFVAVEKVDARNTASICSKSSNYKDLEEETLDGLRNKEILDEKAEDVKAYKKNYSNSYSVKSYKPFVDFSSLDVNTNYKLNTEKPLNGGLSDTELILGIALWVLYPLYPLSVLVSDSNKFLLTFAFYALGFIVVLSGAAANNIALAVIGAIIFFIGWIYALIMLAKNA